MGIGCHAIPLSYFTRRFSRGIFKISPQYNGKKGEDIMDENKYITRQQERHRLVVDNREKIEVSGVTNVDSFDDQEIILETEQVF